MILTAWARRRHALPGRRSCVPVPPACRTRERTPPACLCDSLALRLSESVRSGTTVLSSLILGVRSSAFRRFWLGRRPVHGSGPSLQDIRRRNPVRHGNKYSGSKANRLKAELRTLSCNPDKALSAIFICFQMPKQGF